MKTMLILTRWQLRQLRWINVIVVGAAILFVLFANLPIQFARMPFLTAAVLVHCGLMVLVLGRSEPRGPGFLYAQGFSRDQLWWATFAATWCSGLIVCFCLWLSIVTGLRSQIQEFLGNPWFPMAGTIEASTIKWFLLEYSLLLPPLHYVWVRARQPQRDAAAGWMLAMVCLSFYLFCLGYLEQASPQLLWLMLAVVILLAVLMLVGCWKFHRRVEVQS